jgi:hypothetical protein
MAKQRADIQNQIQQLNEQRKKYVAGQMKMQQKEAKTLGSAVVIAIRGQAGKKNFSFKPPEDTSKKTEETASR